MFQDYYNVNVHGNVMTSSEHAALKRNAPTIRDVAKLAGVSINTVSRVLNNKGEISPEVRESVLKAARELGYRPNRSAQRLRRRSKTQVVGTIVADISNPFFAAVLKGVEAKAYEHGYTVIIGDSREDEEREAALVDAMLAERVEGLLIAPVLKESSVLSELSSTSQLPIISFARYPANSRVPYVVPDGFQGGYLATKHLLEQGYENVLLVNGPQSDATAHDRLKGYEKALKEHGIKFRAKLVRFGAMTIEDGVRLGKDLLQLSDPPLGVHAFSDYVALGILSAAEKLGLAVPEELGIVGFDDVLFSRYLTPPLTTIGVPKEELGEQAFELLTGLNSNPQRAGMLHRKMSVELIIRGSTCKQVRT